MTDDEAVAIAMALDALLAGNAEETAPSTSRWKVADRKPDLEIEELRAIH
jgi:hypothetical protein